MSPKKTIIVAIALFVGMLHFIISPGYRGPLHVFIHSYLIDILLPMSMFLITGLIQHSRIACKWVRALAVVAVGFAVETAQFFGIEIFGRTFDPVDYLMYVSGVVFGVCFEHLVLDRLISVKSGI